MPVYLRDKYGNVWRVKVVVVKWNIEEMNEKTKEELEEIFKLFWLNNIQINSAETIQWKQEVLKQLKFTKEKIKKIDIIIEKIVTRLTNKFSKKLWYVKTIRLFQKLLEQKKTTNAKRNALIDYINYSFEEYIEDYENKLFRWNIDNPFSKYYAAHLKILWREAEIDIELKLITKLWKTREWMDKNYGWIFSKKWLEYLKWYWIISQEEYNKYVLYTPTVDWLLKTLEEEWSIHAIAKKYFPDEVWAQDWFNQAVKDYLSEMIEVLDPRDIPLILLWISRGLKKAVTWDYNAEIVKQKAWELYDIFTNLDDILAWLDSYKKSYYKTYVWTNLSLSVFPASRLKALKKVKWGWDSKVMKEVKELKRKKDLLKKLKPIKSFDSHIFTKHAFSSTNKNASKFLQWADIKALIREGYSKTNKKIEKAVSKHPKTWEIIDTIKIEVDMWKIIWEANKKTSKLRIIVDYEWNIISSYPIDKILIK